MTFSTAVPLSPWQVLSGQYVIPVSLTDQTGSTATVSNPQPIADYALHAGEDTTFDRQWGGNKASNYTTLSAALATTFAVKSTSAFYYGYGVVTTGTAGSLTTVFNGSSITGQVLDIIASTVALGTDKNLSTPKPAPNGIFVNCASTQVIGILYT